MNLDKLFSWVAGIVIAFAVMGKLDVLQAWIWRAQAKVVYQSRTSTWGSPRFFSPAPKTPIRTEPKISVHGTKVCRTRAARSP